MESKWSPDDIWYALAHTEVLLAPTKRLETFGNTIIHYHLISEKLDSVNEVRVREGKVHAEKPVLLTPAYYERMVLDGFGDEAHQFVQWLRENAQDLTFLKYGFQFRKEAMQESTVHENLETVIARVRGHVEQKADPLSAVIKGVDDAWEISLLKFTVDTIKQAAPDHVREMQRRKLMEARDGVPNGVREEIEAEFEAAGSSKERVKKLGAKLQEYGVFESYEDRFFELVRRIGG